MSSASPPDAGPHPAYPGPPPVLLDGAGAALQPLPPELEACRLVAGDASRPVEQRLEAFEDISDCEVGDTTLSRGRHIEREHGVRQIYLKFEAGNPTGTQKDRIAFAQARDALRRGFDTITAATCGNYGVAVSLAASMAGLRPLIYIPETYRSRRVTEMESLGATIVRSAGDYEAAVLRSREHAERDELYDANPGGANTPLQMRAYGEIAHEIYDELRDAPAVVAVPVSNGTTLAGIYRGFLSLHRRGRTSRIPRMVACSAYRQNPIIRGFLAGSERCDDLRPSAIRETAINEPLVNWHSSDGEHALEAIRASGGWAAWASDRAMIALARKLRDTEALNVLPAAAAGLHALIDYLKRNSMPGDRYVAVLTGRRR